VIDLLVVSHADADHLGGLVSIVQDPRIEVKRIVHSGIATFAKDVLGTTLGDLATVDGRQILMTRHNTIADLPAAGLSRGFGDWRNAIAAEAGLDYFAVDTTTGILDVGDPSVGVEVLVPRLVPGAQGMGYPWFGDPAHTINGHSVVLRIVHGNVRALFSGDLNIPGSLHLLADPSMAERLDAHVFKAPHHGSHEFYPPFIDAVRPQLTVISSGDDPDHGHPRAIFIGAVGRATRSNAPLVFSTEIAQDFVEVGDPPRAAGGGPRTLEEVDETQPGAHAELQRLFKRSLNGMINVRSDGSRIYSARRVRAGYQWESYGRTCHCRAGRSSLRSGHPLQTSPTSRQPVFKPNLASGLEFRCPRESFQVAIAKTSVRLLPAEQEQHPPSAIAAIRDRRRAMIWGSDIAARDRRGRTSLPRMERRSGNE
jgi:hypothetical protein